MNDAKPSLNSAYFIPSWTTWMQLFDKNKIKKHPKRAAFTHISQTLKTIFFLNLKNLLVITFHGALGLPCAGHMVKGQAKR